MMTTTLWSFFLALRQILKRRRRIWIMVFIFFVTTLLSVGFGMLKRYRSYLEVTRSFDPLSILELSQEDFGILPCLDFIKNEEVSSSTANSLSKSCLKIIKRAYRRSSSEYYKSLEYGYVSDEVNRRYDLVRMAYEALYKALERDEEGNYKKLCYPDGSPSQLLYNSFHHDYHFGYHCIRNIILYWNFGDQCSIIKATICNGILYWGLTLLLVCTAYFVVHIFIISANIENSNSDKDSDDDLKIASHRLKRCTKYQKKQQLQHEAKCSNQKIVTKTKQSNGKKSKPLDVTKDSRTNRSASKEKEEEDFDDWVPVDLSDGALHPALGWRVTHDPVKDPDTRTANYKKEIEEDETEEGKMEIEADKERVLPGAYAIEDRNASTNNGRNEEDSSSRRKEVQADDSNLPVRARVELVDDNYPEAEVVKPLTLEWNYFW